MLYIESSMGTRSDEWTDAVIKWLLGMLKQQKLSKENVLEKTLS